jgi:hypothetical protein
VSTDASATRGTGSARVGAARIIGLDLVGPLLVYRLCRSGGMSQVWALVVSGTTPGLGVLIDYVRWRTLEIVGAVVLAGIALSLVLALASGSPKAVLLESAITSAAFGVVCLISLRWRRPLLFHFIQTFYGGRHTAEGAGLDEAYAAYETARRYFRIVTIVWGLANFVEATVKAVVVQFVSTGTALAVNRILPAVLVTVLFAWTYRWGMRLRAERETVQA